MRGDSKNRFWEGCRGRRFLIVGCTERTGLSVARLFRQQHVDFAVSDLKFKPEVRRGLVGIGVPEHSIFEGIQTEDQLEGIDDIILSPGVSRLSSFVLAAKEKGIQVWSDVDFFFPLYEGKRIVGITGTDGKTTVVHLLEVFLGGTTRVVACGNNGVPIAGLIDGLDRIDVLVLELSSYMLEEVSQFQLDVGAITNLSSDHEDRYDSFFDYAKTKLNLLSRLRSGGAFGKGLFLRNMDDLFLAGPATGEVLSRVSDVVEAKTMSVRDAAADFSWVGGEISLDGGVLASGVEPKLLGNHNKANLLTAAALGFLLGVGKPKLLRAIESVKGLEHRMEEVFVGEAKPITVVNDSKATTQQAVLAALGGFAGGERKVMLVVGGRAKSGNPKDLKTFASKLAAQKNLKMVGCYGDVGEELHREVEAQSNGFLRAYYEHGFEACVRRAWRVVGDGHVLLLSPGFASQDQFDDYEARGHAFKQLVFELGSVR